jgi:hypothetical protein
LVKPEGRKRETTYLGSHYERSCSAARALVVRAIFVVIA